LRVRALWYFYARRLRVHIVQELLAGVGVAVAVALVFAVTVANSSVASSAGQIVHAVIGPADLQLRARGPEGFPEGLLAHVEQLPGVARAAPLLEQTATLTAPNGRRMSVDVAGTDLSLALLDGLAETLPIGALSGGIGLSKATAAELGLSKAGHRLDLLVDVRGRARRLSVSAILGRETAGALSQAQVAVMPLSRLQRLAGLEGRVSRVLVQSERGRAASVRRELLRVAGGRLTVSAANQDVSLLNEALRPSGQASTLFAGLSALLGFLFAFNAMLLTVPERREAIADLRMDGTSRAGIVQMVIFQALCLGLVASMVGLGLGAILSTSLFHQSPGYLTKAFTLGTGTVVGVWPVVFALAGGVIATCLASLIPLQDLRRGRALDAGLAETPARTVGSRRTLATGTLVLLLAASGLFAADPSSAIFACVLLALATVLAVPLVLSIVLGLATALAAANDRLTALPLALSSLKGTAFRSLALASTGAVALFGSVALGSSRDDLLRGIDGYTRHYVSSADLWVVNPEDNQATDDFQTDSLPTRISAIPGVASVHAFPGSFLDIGDRRVWMIALPAGVPAKLLEGQIASGQLAGAEKALRAGGAVTVSGQLAAEAHTHVGKTIAIPTPAGPRTFVLAATTTNFGWTPGAILMNAADYSRDWNTTASSALGIDLAPGADPAAVSSAIRGRLGSDSGLEVLTARTREATIESSASEGLGQLADIATLLMIAAILAMAAALGSSIWQRRRSLAELRLEGAPRSRLQIVLLLESLLLLGAGCLTGALAGVYGQVVIDGYLKNVTGFPVAGVSSGQRPFEIFVIVIVAVLLLVSAPGWFASAAPARLALED
jgi:putative ABC transport system permease protein